MTVETRLFVLVRERLPADSHTLSVTSSTMIYEGACASDRLGAIHQQACRVENIEKQLTRHSVPSTTREGSHCVVHEGKWWRETKEEAERSERLTAGQLYRLEEGVI